MGDRIRRVYCPMTETGFYIFILSAETTAWIWYQPAGKTDDWECSYHKSGNYVWNFVQNGK